MQSSREVMETIVMVIFLPLTIPLVMLFLITGIMDIEDIDIFGISFSRKG